MHPMGVESVAWLTRWVEQQGFSDLSCTLVLSASDYQLLRVEAPTVEAAEMASAVRWRVKDFLEQPIEEFAVDYFALPADAYHGRQNMLYVAATQKTRINALAEMIEEAELVLDHIDIEETAVQALVGNGSTVAPGAGLICLDQESGFLNLCQADNIYLTRRIDFGSKQLSKESDQQFDALLLEVQRSFDYYESQIGKGVIKKLYLSPNDAVSVQAAAYLSEALRVEAEVLSIDHLLPENCSLDEEHKSECVYVLGIANLPTFQIDDVQVA